eukprot:TRINITY_DN20396_c0_g1_i1.p1 TRINITY_DN20396_c0_g1~~TRINITY_DN20396_c0_g1_i1.p1  ORF type:complete len:253 (+),score=57.71 TRINITY_DN20396_c0_g1_i1:112-870(+)
MGVVLSMVLRHFAPLGEARLLMVGLDNAGKTTILHRLKFAEVANTVPTIGFNVETVEYGKLSMAVWDIGGQDSIRKLWRHYYSGANGVIFVVDSSDQLRLEDARVELHRLLGAVELRELPVLVYLNKQDLEGKVSRDEAIEKLKLDDLENDRWFVQEASATSGNGLYEGLDWLASAVQKSMIEQRSSSLLTDAIHDQAQRASKASSGLNLLGKALSFKPQGWSSSQRSSAQIVAKPDEKTVRQRASRKQDCE